MKKKCYICEKELTQDDVYQFFPEDDSYICKKCLNKTSKDKPGCGKDREN